MRILLGIAMASVVLWVNAFARNAVQVAHVRVCLQNLSSAPSRTIGCAEMECARIFRKAGIAIDWVPPGSAQPDDLRVIVTATPARGTSPGVLGYVTETSAGAAAFVVWPRVLDWLAFDRPAYEIVGRVMAHEIGHLLLPDAPHAPVGLMRGVWPADDLRAEAAGSFFFTPDQSASLGGARGVPILKIFAVPRDVSP